MYQIFNTFKRHYRKTKDVFRLLVAAGSFRFESRYSKDRGMEARVLTPDSELTVRFVVLMRRFLNSTDPLYYRSIWQLLKDQFGSEIPREAIEAFETLDARLSTGAGIKIKYNGEDLSPERIYQMLAEGEYFNRDDQARAFLAAIAQIPLAGQLFWFQFYTYTVDGIRIASLIFDVIQIVEQTESYKAQYGDLDADTNRCIFCLTTTGKFTSEEHIVPESLGNAEWLLPKGYVCDACNNGILARLDNELAASPLFAFQRVQYVPYDKKGKLPEARLGTTTMKRTNPLNVTMRTDPSSDSIKPVEELEDGWVRFSFKETLQQKFDERLLARALCKVALELVAADHGQDFACGDRYNAVRAFITAGSDFHSNLLMRTKFTPRPEINITYLPLSEGTLVELHIYGIMFGLNLEEQPSLDLSDKLLEFDFVAFPLYGESSWQDFELEMVPDPVLLDQLPHQYRSGATEPQDVLATAETATQPASTDQSESEASEGQ